MKDVRTKLNNKEYKAFCEEAKRRRLTPYGFAKKLVMISLCGADKTIAMEKLKELYIMQSN